MSNKKKNKKKVEEVKAVPLMRAKVVSPCYVNGKMEKKGEVEVEKRDFDRLEKAECLEKA